MTALKDNIDYYMELKGIKKYSELLYKIAHNLNKSGELGGLDPYTFVAREKSNFSKMLKGQRPLKYDFIIPLEEIFGVSLARIVNENAYKLPVEKDNIPFDKGFRYYAYLDEPELYEKEFDRILDKEGKPVVCNADEFGKTFLDYVAEYGSVNGVRYLYNTYGIKIKWYHNQFSFNKTNGVTWIHSENAMPFCRLVANMNEPQLFYSIYDSYHMFFSNGHYATNTCIFCRSEYLELIMDNDQLFSELFKVTEYRQFLGKSAQRELGKEYITRYSANPILNNCLKYALSHLDQYREQAIRILKFGHENNRRIVEGRNVQACYMVGFLGGIENFNDKDFYELAIIACGNYNDDEVQRLIDDLPRFNDVDKRVEQFYTEEII